ncbi:RDD family protein [Polynucleobacter sp. AP-Nino-20-G2]|uniref:RDD family protein n=1 Tax=Polynucleobacter sp. AP-Nino-20-G2 TaxID=2576917 RepID=UPI001BFE941C|nr:RDD family protein [Polynucleobacter sp. AP-Nino-20-G2]QWE16323.1 RDD family protein [Polynucleobacter sp. AP-Nino-20-G2]
MTPNSSKPLITKEVALSRLKIGFSIALVMAVIFSVGMTVLGLINWNKESDQYQAKVVEQHKSSFCTAINRYPDGSDFTLEIAALYGEQTEQWPGWKYAKNFQYCNANPYLYSNSYSTCYFARMELFNYFGCVDAPLSVGETLGNIFKRYWTALLFGFLAIGLIPLVAFFVGRLVQSGLLVERHPGWRRVQIATVGLVFSIGVIRAFVRLNNWSDTFIDDLLIALLISIISWLGFLLLRFVMRWLKEGFQTAGAQVAQDTSAQNLSYPAKDIESKVEAEMIQATFWSRLWARTIDIFIVWLVAGLIDLPGLLLILIVPSSATMFLMIAELITGLLWLCLFLYLYDSYMIYKFQTTIGKLAVGIRVLNKNYQPMSLVESKSRAYLVISKALSFMIFYPLVQAFNAWQAKKALDNGLPVAWDHSGTVVQQKRISVARLTIVAVLAISLLLTQLVLQKVQKEITKQEIRSSVLR